MYSPLYKKFLQIHQNRMTPAAIMLVQSRLVATHCGAEYLDLSGPHAAGAGAHRPEAAHKARDAGLLLEAYARTCVAARVLLISNDAEQLCRWAC